MTYDDAEALSKSVLLGIFPVLPGWCLHNPDWVGQKVEVGKRRFYVAISPWIESRSGRGYHFWPAGSTPASRLAVKGFLTISDGKLQVEPKRFFGAKRWRKEPTGQKVCKSHSKPCR